jgi:hypothetical protein
VRIGWLLLALVGISQITMPLTQHLWTWDRYLRGGQDFETGAFLILVSFCLMVVIMRACKSSVEHLLSCLRGPVMRPAPGSRATFLALASPRLQQAVRYPAGTAYSLPLQI